MLKQAKILSHAKVKGEHRRKKKNLEQALNFDSRKNVVSISEYAKLE